MSRIQGRPFIELVIGTLNEEKKKKLLNLVNGTDEQPAFRSLINPSNYITDADKNDVSHIVLETWHKTFTGYLIYNNTYCVLISYSRNTQDLNLLSINLTNQTYTTIRQSLTILELRFILNDVSEHITPGDIDSGDAPKGQVLTADGESGASWGFPSMERIIDANGNFRFVEGNGIIPDTLPTGFNIMYSKWSLSGTHLMLVLAGTIENGTIVPIGVNRPWATFNLPNYILDKIIPVWATDFIESKSATLRADDWTTQSQTLSLIKKTNALELAPTGSATSITLTAKRNFKIQFDLLIDAE